MKKKQVVRLGLYGCGNRTRALLDSLYGENEYQVVAAYDLRQETTKAVCEKYGGKACANKKELIACREADAFIISLDPFAHPDAFDQTLAAGKPIFIEKPIAMSAERAYRMMKKAQAGNIPVHVGLVHRYYRQHIAARQFINANPPGRLFGISCNWFHAGETEMLNCLFNQPDNFRLKVSQIPFHCCHALDVIRTYAGQVRAVDARGIKWVDRKYPSPDNVIATFEFENDSIGSFHYSSMSYKHELSYVIHYENYTLTFENGLEIWYRPQHRSQREGELLTAQPGKPGNRADCRTNYVAQIGPDKYQFTVGQPIADAMVLTDFLDAVRQGTPMKVSIEEGYKVAELADAIEMSYTQNKKIELPLRFKGG